jgi:hypothetical protein
VPGRSLRGVNSSQGAGYTVAIAPGRDRSTHLNPPALQDCGPFHDATSIQIDTLGESDETKLWLCRELMVAFANVANHLFAIDFQCLLIVLVVGMPVNNFPFASP